MFGPAILVTAAFIGPGTVMAASKAGSQYGFTLLWAVAFSILATIVLQEMAARLGIVTGAGLSQAIRSSVRNGFLRVAVLGLVLLAILVGNAAYQTGNLLGAASGVEMVAQEMESGGSDSATTKLGTTDTAESWNWKLSLYTIVVAAVAAGLILLGRFLLLQRVLTFLVVSMSVLFLLAAILSGPNLSSLAAGFWPRIPQGSDWFVIGLIGTTVVPYNLFLHASAAAQRWPADAVKKTLDKEKAIKDSRRDTTYSILIGGVVTAAILVTASAAFHGQSVELVAVSDVASQLRPALGRYANWLLGVGLLAAGLTSAMTAPIAAAYATAGCFGWPNQLSDWRLKSVALGVILVGVGFAIALGKSPAETILLAQVANGLLLPIIAVFLLWMLNRVSLMHRFHNTLTNNILGGFVLIVVSLIAARQLNLAYQKLLELLAESSSVVSLLF